MFKEKRAPRRRSPDVTPERILTLIRALTLEGRDFYRKALPGEPAEISRHEWRWVAIHQILLRADTSRAALWLALDQLLGGAAIEFRGADFVSSRGELSLTLPSQ